MTPPPDRPRRHDWVWLAEGWRAHRIGSAPEPADAAERVEVWQARGLPLVVARNQPDDGEDDLRLGLALPDKRRVGLHLAAGAVARRRPPPRLADVLAAAPPEWRDGLAALDGAFAALGLEPRTYGSFAWQFWSGDAYVRPASDLDLLLAPATAAQLPALLAVLRAHRGAPRLDGEVLLPDGGAVAWRELADAPAQVLVKTPRTVELRALDAVRRAMERAAA